MIENGPLHHLIARHKALALAIAREFPEADEETLADTLEGASDLPQLLISVLRSRAEDLSLAEALRGRLETMRARLERLESRAEQKRNLVTTALQEAGIRKLVAPEFTAYLRPSSARLIVTDRGRPLATLAPVDASAEDEALLKLVAEGLVNWNGKRPVLPPRGIKLKGTRLASDDVLEDRR